MSIRHTVCRMCGEACPIYVHVENGQAVKIEGVPNNPRSNGKVCGKGIAALQLEYDPRRLTHPLRRIGDRGEGKWEKISWDTALEIISERLLEIKEKDGPEALVYHFGAAIGQVWPYINRFMNVYGSPNKASHSHLCYQPRNLAHVATYGAYPQEDVKNTKLFVLWAQNHVNSALLTRGRAIFDAIRNGAKLIVIDPVFTALASKADLFIQPRPGTDGALGLAMINVIINEDLYDHDFVEKWTYGFDELKEMVSSYTPKRVEEITWVPAEQIIKLARTYAQTKPAVLGDGNGFDQHTNVTQSVRVVAILRAITGNLNIPGGNVIRSDLGVPSIDLAEKLPKDVKPISQNPFYYDVVGWDTTPHVVDSILTGKPYPVKAMIVHGSGAGIIASNCEKTIEAFKKLEFLVVNDFYMTATAEIADIVLPAATHLEKDCLMISAAPTSAPSVDTAYICMMNKVVEPLGECWGDHEFICELGKRMGYGEFFTSPVDVFNQQLKSLGLSVDKVKRSPEGILIQLDPQKVYHQHEKTGFKTPTGKVELYSTTLEKYRYDPLPIYKEPAESPMTEPETAQDYPLVTSASLRLGLYKHNQFQTLPWIQEIVPDPYVQVNPETAETLGIHDGDSVLVESKRGRIEVVAQVTEEVDPRVVMVTHGWGHPYARGYKTNLLTDDKERCIISGSTGNRSFLSRIRKKGD